MTYEEVMEKLLKQIKETVHTERNRVRYVMNNFAICAGAYYAPLSERAKKVAESIGKVHVGVDNTACSRIYSKNRRSGCCLQKTKDMYLLK